MSWRPRLIVLSCLIILVLVTVSVNSDPTKGASLPDKVLLEVVGRLQQAFTGSARAVESVWRELLLPGETCTRRISSLERTVGLLRSQINDLKEAKLANQRLANILKFKAGRDFPYVGADVVSWNPNNWFKTITINRGSQDGLDRRHAGHIPSGHGGAGGGGIPWLFAGFADH